MDEFLYYVKNAQGRIVAGFDDIKYAEQFASLHQGFYVDDTD